MEKHEKIFAAFRREYLEYVPFSLWMHHLEYDDNPVALAEREIEFALEYDVDILKLNPSGAYTVRDRGAVIDVDRNRIPVAKIKRPAILSQEDWDRIEKLPPDKGAYQDRILCIDYIQKELDGVFPMMETIFSPLTTARKLRGDEIVKDLIEIPDRMERVLSIIADETVDYIKRLSLQGVEGIFFATQVATSDLMEPGLHKRFGVKYDLSVLDRVRDDLKFIVIHIHGENIMFEHFVDYPHSALSWHVNLTRPSIREARERYNTVALCGINRATLWKGTKEDIKREIVNAVKEADGQGIIIGPGCTIPPAAPLENLLFVRDFLRENTTEDILKA